MANNSEVAHRWAQQDSSSRTVSSGNLNYNGTEIYSYGHYCIARFVDPDTVFIQSRWYSNTTARHISEVLSAVSHKDTFTVPVVTSESISTTGNGLTKEENLENLRYLIAQAEEYVDKHIRARSSDYTTEIKTSISVAREYVKYVDKRLITKAMWKVLSDVNLHELFQIGDKRLIKMLEKKKKVEEAKERNLKRWRKDDYSGDNLPDGQGVFLRVVQRTVNGELTTVVETSKHVKIPAEQVRHVWVAVSWCEQKKEQWSANGQQIRAGIYYISRITTDGDLIAGCHTIRFEECKAAAIQLGFTTK